MNVIPLSNQIDALDHRRARVQEILSHERLSPELRQWLEKSLLDIEQRIGDLQTAQAASHLLAAPQHS